MPLPPADPYARPMSAPVEGRVSGGSSSNRDTGETLVLVGAIVSLVFLVLFGFIMLILMVVFMVVAGEAKADLPAGFGAMLGLYGGVFAILGTLQVVGIVLAFGGRRLSKEGNAARGWPRALAGGILTVLMNQIAGALIIVGAVLMKPPPSVAPVQPAPGRQGQGS